MEFNDRRNKPEGYSNTTFGQQVKNVPLSKVNPKAALGENSHLGRHVRTISKVSTTDPYDGDVMHHALIQTDHPYSPHSIVHMHADGSMLNSESGPLDVLKRRMANLKNDTNNPTGGYFDPMPGQEY